ncbi:MAG TPA: hypothetical protein PL089_05185 [Ignavibacteria bacterium]|nr:hypothetical protein [Ignavibacteria bacterium]
MKILILFFLYFFLSVSLSLAQTISGDHDYSLKSLLKSKPSIEVSYGVSDIKFSGTPYNFSPTGLIELNLGFTSNNTSKFRKNIVSYKNRFLFLSFNSEENSVKSNNSGIKSNLWKFGLGNKSGYGVSIGKSAAILPYSSRTFNWSNFKYDKQTDNSSALSDENYYSELDNMSGVFRFGSSFEAGINLQITKGFSIQPKYETADIFPRHLAGKQLMSSAIEYAGFGLLETFTKAVMKNSPVAGTFVNFILLNAYEYGFYQLKKDQMYWPFVSSAPLRYETFKLGMTFVF